MEQPFAFRQIRKIQQHLAALRGHGEIITDECGSNPRTAYQFFLSVFFYLTWRSGDCWRSFQYSGQRYHPERWYYLNGKRLLQDVFFASDVLPQKKPAARVTSARVGTSARAAGRGAA